VANPIPLFERNLQGKRRIGLKKARFLLHNSALNQCLAENSATPPNSGIKSAEQGNDSAEQRSSSGIVWDYLGVSPHRHTGPRVRACAARGQAPAGAHWPN